MSTGSRADGSARLPVFERHIDRFMHAAPAARTVRLPSPSLSLTEARGVESGIRELPGQKPRKSGGLVVGRVPVRSWSYRARIWLQSVSAAVGASLWTALIAAWSW